MPQPAPAPRPPAPAPAPRPSASPSSSKAGATPPTSRYEKQLALLLHRQKQFKEAAIQAKKNGESLVIRIYIYTNKLELIVKSIDCYKILKSFISAVCTRIS